MSRSEHRAQGQEGDEAQKEVDQEAEEEEVEEAAAALDKEPEGTRDEGRERQRIEQRRSDALHTSSCQSSAPDQADTEMTWPQSRTDDIVSLGSVRRGTPAHRMSTPEV